jgi:histidinol phosphatase-like PHP family hydrolase
LTDHVDFTNIEHVLSSQLKIKDKVDWDIEVLVGVELTHIPVGRIPAMVEKARELGAEIVVGHGESPVEPVEEGTNAAYIEAGVDILAHPGNITLDEAKSAMINDVFLELTSRRGHMQGNVHVAGVAREAQALMIVSTDAHAPEDLITQGKARGIALQSGLPEDAATEVVAENPLKLLARIR